MTEEKRLFNYTVNGFRGLCVFLVFIFHVANSRIIPPVESLGSLSASMGYFFDSFKYGVESFFMISGYVIIGSLKRHANFKAFLIDRSLRIYPTWVPLNILGFIIGPFTHRGLFADFNPLYWTISFFVSLFLLTPVVPTPLVHPAAWSLSYEWCFYLIVGIGTFYFRPQIGNRAGAIIMCLLAVVMINLFPRGLFFIPGVLLALYEDKFRQYARYLIFPTPALIAFLLIWRGTDVAAAELTTTLTEWVSDHRIVYLLVAFPIATYMFACVVLGTGYLSVLLNKRPMQFYGKISYAFYLWSPLMMAPTKLIATRFVGPHLGAWGAVAFFALVSFALSTVVSWANWHFIEKKLTGILKEKIRKVKPVTYAQASTPVAGKIEDVAG